MPDTFVLRVASTGGSTPADTNSGSSTSIKDSSTLSGTTLAITQSGTTLGGVNVAKVQRTDLAAFAGPPVAGAGGDTLMANGVLYHIGSVFTTLVANDSLALYENPATAGAVTPWCIGGYFASIAGVSGVVGPSGVGGNGCDNHTYVDAASTLTAGTAVTFSKAGLTATAKFGRPEWWEPYSAAPGDGSSMTVPVSGSSLINTFVVTGNAIGLRNFIFTDAGFSSVPAAGWRAIQVSGAWFAAQNIKVYGTKGASLSDKTAGIQITASGSMVYQCRAYGMCNTTAVTMNFGQLAWPTTGTAAGGAYCLADTIDVDLGFDQAYSFQYRIAAFSASKQDNAFTNNGAHFCNPDNTRDAGHIVNSFSYNAIGASNNGNGISHGNAGSLGGGWFIALNVGISNVLALLRRVADVGQPALLVTGQRDFGSGSMYTGVEAFTLRDTAAQTWTPKDVTLTASPIVSATAKNLTPLVPIQQGGKTLLGGADTDGRYPVGSTTTWDDSGPIQHRPDSGWFVSDDDIDADEHRRLAGLGSASTIALLTAGLMAKDRGDRRGFFKRAAGAVAAAIAGKK